MSVPKYYSKVNQQKSDENLDYDNFDIELGDFSNYEIK